MKKMITLVMLVVAMGITQGQSFTEKSSSGSRFDVESGTLTGQTFTCDSKVFDIYETSNGSKYVIGISKGGNPYPVWIGEETEHMFDGKPVRHFASGAYAYFRITSNGYPYACWLNADDN